jgi:hypothetical protein
MFTINPESFGGASAFMQLTVAAWAYAVTYPELRGPKVSEFVEDATNSPLSA